MRFDHWWPLHRWRRATKKTHTHTQSRTERGTRACTRSCIDLAREDSAELRRVRAALNNWLLQTGGESIGPSIPIHLLQDVLSLHVQQHADGRGRPRAGRLCSFFFFFRGKAAREEGSGNFLFHGRIATMGFCPDFSGDFVLLSGCG